jgi:FG-GAP-like repeat
MRSFLVTFIGSLLLLLVILPSESFAGQFLTYTSYPGGSPFAFASGDFNGDGRYDLAVLNSSDGNVSVFLASADGILKTPVTYAIGVNPSSIAVADLNGDGKLDIVVANNGDPKISEFGDVGILLGNGNGTFRKAIQADVGSIFPDKLVVADFDGDGIPDLAVVTTKPAVLRIYLGNGNGKFRIAAKYLLAGHFALFLAADFNQDGKEDLAILSGGNCHKCNEVTVLLGNGNGTFQTGIVTDLPYESTAMVAGDFNNDERVDLVVNRGVFLSGNGDGTFSIVNEDVYFESAAAGDLNGDGKLDLVTVEGSQTATILGNGDGTFQSSTAYDVGPEPVAVGALNLSGNGRLDAVTFTITQGGNIGVALGNGDGTLQAASLAGVGGGPYPIIAADFNNDKKIDLAVTEGGGQGDVFVFLGNGDGTFAYHGGICTLTGTPGLALRSADFNHDGNLDLAVGNITTDRSQDIGICLGNGDGTFQSGPTCDRR